VLGNKTYNQQRMWRIVGQCCFDMNKTDDWQGEITELWPVSSAQHHFINGGRVPGI
jgi:hypothetical protein